MGRRVREDPAKTVKTTKTAALAPKWAQGRRRSLPLSLAHDQHPDQGSICFMEGVALASAYPRRVRTPAAGPELELVEAALESGLPFAGPQPFLFRELAMPSGFPDIVAVFLSKRQVLFTTERSALGSDHLKLLHHLYATGGTSVDSLVETLVWRRRDIDRLLEDLELAGLARQAGQNAICAPLAEVFVAKRIVAIEAKIRDWRAAIRQALTNTWFASHSYILIPARRWNERLGAEAVKCGIGVLVHDGARTRVKHRAQDRRIPASYGSWIVNEWTVRLAGRSFQ